MSHKYTHKRSKNNFKLPTLKVRRSRCKEIKLYKELPIGKYYWQKWRCCHWSTAIPLQFFSVNFYWVLPMQFLSMNHFAGAERTLIQTYYLKTNLGACPFHSLLMVYWRRIKMDISEVHQGRTQQLSAFQCSREWLMTKNAKVTNNADPATSGNFSMWICQWIPLQLLMESRSVSS